MSVWMIGGSSRLLRERRSLSTASSSLRVRAMMRSSEPSMTLREPLVRDEARARADEKQHPGEHCEIREQHRPQVPGEEYGLQQRHVIARGQDVGNGADRDWHAAQIE